MPKEKKIEEETYSTIFSSLKHPIRRKILRMLAREPRTFSEILEAVSIDSGHLNYHLENLGDLITHSPDGKYVLSSVGVAAVKLMSGVEEHPPPTVSLRGKGKRILNFSTKIFLTVLILALIASSLFFIGFVQSEEIDHLYSEEKIAIARGQILEYNVTFIFKKGGHARIQGGNPFIWERHPPVNTITRWEEGFFQFWLEKNETIGDIEMWLTCYDPAGKVLFDGFLGVQGATALSLSENRQIIQNGTYRLLLKNVGTEQINGIIGPDIYFYRYERPYFYWGIVGLLIASAYPAFALVRRIWD